MTEFFQLIAIAFIPALGNFAGGVFAEFRTVSTRSLRLALHLAVGIVLGVVAVELAPRFMEANRPWITILAFFGGGCFAVAVDLLIGKLMKRSRGGEKSSGAWMIFFGTSVDLFSDGIMIGTGSTIAFSLAVLLALGQVAADVPEGFATVAMFKGQKTTRARRLFLSASFAVPILLGSTIGYWLVRGRPELLKLSLLAFTAGVLTTVAVEQMLTEAHQRKEGEPKAEEAPLYVLALVGGFTLFAFLSAYLG